MWAKIALCAVLLFHMFGNVAFAAPTPPAKTTENKPNQDNKSQSEDAELVAKITAAIKRANQQRIIAENAQKKAEGARDKVTEAQISSIDSWKRMKLAKNVETRAKQQANAENKLKEAQQQKIIAMDQAKIAMAAAQNASNIANSTSTWNLNDADHIDKLQADADKEADAAYAAYSAAHLAAEDAIKKVEVAEEVAEEAAKEEPYANCNAWQIGCYINSWFYSIAKGILLGVIEMLESAFQLKNLSNEPIVKSLKTGFNNLAWPFLMLFLVYQLVRILSFMVLQEDYSDLKPLVRSTVVAAWLVSSLTWICNQLFVWANLFTKYALSHLEKLKISLRVIIDIVVVGAADYFLVLLVVISVLCISILIQIGIRSAEFAFLVIIGPIAIVTMVNKEMNYFPIWWRNLLSIVIIQAIQPIFFVISIQMIAKGGLLNIFMVIGFLTLTYRSPQMIKEWLQSASSTGGGSLSAGATVTDHAREGWSKGRGLTGKLKGGLKGGIVSGGQALFRSLTKR